MPKCENDWLDKSTLCQSRRYKISLSNIEINDKLREIPSPTIILNWGMYTLPQAAETHLHLFSLYETVQSSYRRVWELRQS